MNPNTSTARDLLAFYLDAGADALSARSRSTAWRKSTSPALRRHRRSSPRRKARPNDPHDPETKAASAQGAGRAAAPEAAVMAARAAARNAKTLDELRALLEKFDGCALRATATQLVFADGNPQSRVMFVGEAPGHDEDIRAGPSSAAPASCSTG